MNDTESPDAVRAEFEGIAGKQVAWPVDIEWVASMGCYSNAITELAWRIFQIARSQQPSADEVRWAQEIWEALELPRKTALTTEALLWLQSQCSSTPPAAQGTRYWERHIYPNGFISFRCLLNGVEPTAAEQQAATVVEHQDPPAAQGNQTAAHRADWEREGGPDRKGPSNSPDALTPCRLICAQDLSDLPATAEVVLTFEQPDGTYKNFDYADLIRLRDAAAQPQAPGFVLVPVEPTFQMCRAGRFAWEDPPFPPRYKAMLAAAPQYANEKIDLRTALCEHGPEFNCEHCRP